MLPPPIAAFDDAQRRTIRLTRDVVQRLEAGMSERDVFELAETRLSAHGFTGWFHPPEVWIRRSGPPMLPLVSARRKLEAGDLVTIDLGPADGASYGDFAWTLAYGEGAPPKVLEVARTCTRAACGYASRWKTIGEILVFARAWAINRRMDLAGGGAVGHRMLPPEGLLRTGFPRSAHLATLLLRNRIHRLNPERMDGMFAIRPVVSDGSRIAAFEEVVYVHEDVKRVLGRDRLEDAGTLPEPGQPPVA